MIWLPVDLSISIEVVSHCYGTLRSTKKLKSVYRRLVFGLSCMDIVHSLTYVAGGLPVPNDAGSWHSNYAIGNVTTCNIQGFMNYTGLMGSLFYACMLSIYFTLVIVYSKNDNLIQKSVEPFFHAFSILIPLGLGIFLMTTNHFNSVGFTCWIHWYPRLCKEEENIDCTRGEDASWYKIFFQYVPLGKLPNAHATIYSHSLPCIYLTFSLTLHTALKCSFVLSFLRV